MRPLTYLIILSGLFCISPTCTGCTYDASASDGTVVRDSAGITIVENDHTRPGWGDDAWRMSAEPVLRMGALDSDGPDQFYRVMASRRLGDGRIVVVNGGTAEVRVFDERGRYLRTLGRRGEGPGEFRSVWAVYPLPGDSIMVLDLGHAVSVFDSSGTYVRRFVPGDIGGELQGTPIGQFADGTLLLMQYQREDRSRTGLGRSMVRLVEIGLDGSIASDFGLYGNQVVMFGGPLFLFGARAWEAAGDSTMWYGPGDRFEIREIARDGSTMRLVRLDLPPVPVTADVLDEYRDFLRQRAAGTQGEQQTNRVLADAQHHDNLPAHSVLMTDDAANLWVQNYQPVGLVSDQTWYVFDPDSRYLGSMTMPAQFTIHHIGEDFILGRWRDEFDVDYIHMYALEKS